jgi:(p)ppGpp synthase/HD superfamily hydrolase
MAPKSKKDEPTLSPRMYEALELAFKLHGHDLRKSSQVPYIAHLLHVCALVLQDGGDEDEAIAALLHDALEDKPEKINQNKIRKRFGGRVLGIVLISTDTPASYKGGPKPPWHARKEAYLKQVRQADPSLLRVTVADKLDNARSMLADYRRIGEELWEHFNAGKEDQLWYYHSAVAAYRAVGFSGPLLDELDGLVMLLDGLT